MPMGTMAWGERNLGQLSSIERWKLTLDGVVTVLGNAITRKRKALPIAIDTTRPASALARHAEALLVSTSPPWLLNHGLRSLA